MRRATKVALWALAVAAALGSCLSLCIGPRWAEIHLIPEGFTGPVMVVCGVPGGEHLAQDAAGAFVHHVPRDGLLITSNPCRGPGWVNATYFVGEPGGGRRRIPLGADANALQVFGATDGVTNYLYSPIDEIRWYAYMVGVPNEMKDWPEQKQRLEERAISRVMAMRAEAAAGRR